MTPISGIPCRGYIGGHDLSGTIQAIGNIGTPMSPLDATTIDKVAMHKIGGRRDAAFAFTSFFDPDVSHPVLSELPRSDISALMSIGPASRGDNAILVPAAKQIDYGPTVGADGALTCTVNVMATRPKVKGDYVAMWGNMLSEGYEAIGGPSLETQRSVPITAAPHGVTAYVWFLRPESDDSSGNAVVQIVDAAAAGSQTRATIGTVTATGEELAAHKPVVKVVSVDTPIQNNVIWLPFSTSAAPSVEALVFLAPNRDPEDY